MHIVSCKMHFQNYYANRSIKLEIFTSHLQHSRPYSYLHRIYDSCLTLEFVYPTQHGGSWCTYYFYHSFLIHAGLSVESASDMNNVQDKIYNNQNCKVYWIRFMLSFILGSVVQKDFKSLYR